MLFSVEGMFEYMWREGIFSKCHIKICVKSNQQGEWNTLKIINRMTSQQEHSYGISVWAHNEILKISYVEEYLCA